MNKRLFIALPLPDEIKENIKPVIQELRDCGADLKIVSVENLHVTLKFLGEVEERRIPEIVDKLTVMPRKPFSISLQGLGVFPSPDRIKVVWIGIKSAELRSLAKKIHLALNYIHKEEHGETPHLTIARVKSARNKEKLKGMVQKYQSAIFGEMVVDKIVLYESELGKEGPVYKVVREFDL